MKMMRLGFALAVLLSASFACGDYKIVWSTIDGGGGTMTGGAYTLTGTIGQPNAGASSGGGYELLGGFWAGGPLCFVNLEDFAHFAQYWLDAPCSPDNTWCGGADLDMSGDVTLADFGRFLDAWLTYCPYAWPLK